MAASLFIVVKGAMRDFCDIFRSTTIKIQIYNNKNAVRSSGVISCGIEREFTKVDRRCVRLLNQM